MFNCFIKDIYQNVIANIKIVDKSKLTLVCLKTTNKFFASLINKNLLSLNICMVIYEIVQSNNIYILNICIRKYLSENNYVLLFKIFFEKCNKNKCLWFFKNYEDLFKN